MKKISPFLFLFLCFAANAQNTWTQKANFPGQGRELPVGFSIGDKGYVGLGFNFSIYLTDFWEYDPATNIWTQKTDFPGTSRCAAVGFSIGDKGYIGTGGFPYSNDFWEYDPATNTWTQKANLGGMARWKAAGFSIGDKGYIGCGEGYSGTLNDLWEWDQATNVWTQKSDLPAAVSALVGFSANGKGYFATGQGNASNYVWEYDPATNTWTTVASLPADPRVDAVGFSLCGKGYVGTGGYPLMNDFWQYDPSSNQWIQKANIPAPSRDDGTGFSIGSKGYQGLGDSGGGLTDWWEYTPDSACSNIVPSPGFSAADTQLCEKFCTNFFDQSTNNPTAWKWIFAGGVPSSSNDQNPANICYNNPGVYDVTLITTNSLGNDTLILSNYITVNSTPPFPTIVQVGYNLTSSPGYSYQWQFNGGNIAGATNQTYSVMQSGYYTAIVGDSTGCVNSITVYVLITGTNDLISDGNILIYPNPSSGNFIVEWSHHFPHSGGSGLLSIHAENTLGQEVFSSEPFTSSGISSFKKAIDLTSLGDGIYYITVQSENLSLKKKILIAR